MMPPSVADDDWVWVARFQRWGLGSFTPILLDALRPLGFVIGQLLTLMTPVLTTFVAGNQLDQFVALLDDPDRLERVRLMLTDEAER